MEMVLNRQHKGHKYKCSECRTNYTHLFIHSFAVTISSWWVCSITSWTVHKLFIRNYTHIGSNQHHTTLHHTTLSLHSISLSPLVSFQQNEVHLITAVICSTMAMFWPISKPFAALCMLVLSVKRRKMTLITSEIHRTLLLCYLGGSVDRWDWILHYEYA